MKAIMVMFDSLNRRFLPPYGCNWVHAPNFARLAERTATFDNCYAGSMPCMPARREMHTGRYNFLHRSWGPLEPFDDSVPEMLRRAGVYTHLVTDHQHYWEDGGATYHNRYNTYEFFRGQEGDAWKGRLPAPGEKPSDYPQRRTPPPGPDQSHLSGRRGRPPQTRIFDAGLEFIETNADRDRWLLQIETFDPHEPFFSYDDLQDALRQTPMTGPSSTGPTTGAVTEPPETVQHARNEYAALLSMCDASLGRVLDAMDEHELWDDTMLIVCTDHGFLLGEHGWWAKIVQPWYDENIHTPLFIWDPRSRWRAQRRKCAGADDRFRADAARLLRPGADPRHAGAPAGRTIADDAPVREAGLFGAFGGHVNVTDGRYVYMRAPRTPGNQPLLEHTLMPTHMRCAFLARGIAGAELVPPFPFTKGAPVLRMPGAPDSGTDAFESGTLLFDLETDPAQEHPLADRDLELRLINLMLDLMRKNHAPPSQYQRLGLPESGPAQLSHTRTHMARTTTDETSTAS